jgi:Domain of unknown function DUF29
MNKPSLYNQDFYAWTLHTAKLLRQGKFKEIDMSHIAEEIESMGGRERREFGNRLALLIMHLLKWQFQVANRGNSWRYTIKEQRMQITELLEDSPSLKHELSFKLNQAYQKALVMAVLETGLDESVFPKECPYTLDQCLDEQFFPE